MLPGLINAHVHLCGDSRDGALERLPEFTPDHLEGVIATALHDQLASGVTTVRDLGDPHWSVVDRRDAPRVGRAAHRGVGSADHVGGRALLDDGRRGRGRRCVARRGA